MATPQQQRAWDTLVDDVFAVDRAYPFLGQTVEPPDAHHMPYTSDVARADGGDEPHPPDERERTS